MTAFELNFIYRLFDGDERLVYVGITDDIAQRFSKHRRTSAWWPAIVRWDVRLLPSRAAAEAAEAAAISTERPSENGIRPSLRDVPMYASASGDEDMLRAHEELERLREENRRLRVGRTQTDAQNVRLQSENASLAARLSVAIMDVRLNDELYSFFRYGHGPERARAFGAYLAQLFPSQTDRLLNEQPRPIAGWADLL